MLLMDDGGSGFWSAHGGGFSDNGDVGAIGDDFDGDGNFSMDFDTFFHILEEPVDSNQSKPEDLPLDNLMKGVSASDAGNEEISQLPNGFKALNGSSSSATDSMDPAMFYPSYNFQALRDGTGGSFDSAGNSGVDYHHRHQDSSAQIGSLHNCSRSPKNWLLPYSKVHGTERVGVSKFEVHSCSTVPSFVEEVANHVSDRADNMDHSFLEGKTEIPLGHVGGESDSKYASQRSLMANLNENYCSFDINGLEGLGAPEDSLCRSLGFPLNDADISLHNVTSTVFSEISDYCSATQNGMNTDDKGFADSLQYQNPNGLHFQNCPGNEENMANMNSEIQFFPCDEEVMTDSNCHIAEFPTESACSSNKFILNAQRKIIGRTVSEGSLNVYPDVKGQNFKCDGTNYISPICNNFSSNVDEKASVRPFSYIQSHISNRKQGIGIKDDRNDEHIASMDVMHESFEVIDEAVSGKSSYNATNNVFVDADLQQLSDISLSMPSQKHMVYMEDEKEDIIVQPNGACLDGVICMSATGDGHLNLNTSEQYLPCTQSSNSSNSSMGCVEKLIQHKSMGSYLSKVSTESIQSNSSDYKSHVDDDSDICILEDISQPAPSNQSTIPGKSLVASQLSTFNHSLGHMGVGGMRHKEHDERLILRVALLQDLSQPKSETCPPDGVLTVPLLKHQRIALSWMVQMETSGLFCSGGILADDQGLGKTVSTIALILKERPPSTRAALEDAKKRELETLNLDEDDEGAAALNEVKQEAEHCQVMPNRSSVNEVNSLGQAKGRPAAGTLVVCPTSVLRQWDEELHNKVTGKANLSVLVYHGSNRTKDPYELAKYDVVLTTYAIVSMEVPKQPLVDEDENERGRTDGQELPLMGNLSSKKRKYPPSSDKKGSKHKKGMDGVLLESVARPLAKVGWFRVVLDEAQSIKNHRTQVARACWGLRAKRRWCLSGTPIQNAVDDLYSYFRFLRYDPYAVYKSFCSTIKVPVSKNPAKGYRKLQTILKTIMLRRTKGTLLDGEPIVTLPPKVVELKKVDFTKEERDFYSRLETDSRAQFQEYAQAGTVKQNYVNILLMLLRLRQACDHPLLVKGLDSNSMWRSSVEMARKLPREKQMCLLNCLEASLAICGICNDPPEDAVVSVCGHVFCNQCICEHLTGDDNQCPISNCKVRLSSSAVFSKATLSSSLSYHPGQDNSPEGLCSGIVEAVDPCDEGCPYDSSKIKAALEVLESLAKPQDCSCKSSPSQNSLDVSTYNAGDSHDDYLDKINISVGKTLNGSINVVGEKAIVFSQWTRMLDLLEACLKNSSIQYRRLDGTMSVGARDKAVKDFNTLPEVSVMIMSLKAASLGLNLVAACHVLLLDLWWNPTTEDQAIDRAHRIGQTRPVSVLRLTVKDTVEDRILALQQKKREMVASAFGEDETGGRQTRLTVEDLKYLFMV